MEDRRRAESRGTAGLGRPALIVYGEREPEAPGIERLRATLSAAQFIRLAGHAWGDATDWPACVNDLRRSFVLQPTRVLDVERCGRSAKPIAYAATPPSPP